MDEEKCWALPKQIIHRDPNPSNILLTDDKWGFIDFDVSEKNVRIFDPCYASCAILYESFEVGNNEKLYKWVSVMKGIIAGYGSVVKISDKERNAIPYILLANQFVATAWLADSDKYKELFSTNVKMTEWMIQNFETLKLD